MASNELVLHWLQKTCDLTPPHFIAGNSTQKHCFPKRKRSLDSIMQENNASDSSRSPNKRSRTQSETLSGLPKPFATLSTRTKLTPKTQVSSSTRPESPSKDLTFLLRESIPCIICEQPDGVVWTGTMTELAGQLNKKLEEGVIPIALKDKLQSLYPGTTSIPASAFHLHYPGSEDDINALWTLATRIYLEARDCYSYNQDENAWCLKVTQRVLSSWLSNSGDDFFELDSIQSQSIDSSYLPMSRTAGLINKKADYALIFSPRHPEIAEIYRPLLRKGYNLSQMTDTHTKRLVMASGAEIKPANGNCVEALAQLATWFASGFTKIRELNLEAGEGVVINDLPPMIGWTVVGQDWRTYMACDFENDGERVVSMVGPLVGLSASTNSIWDIFKLLALMEGVKEYARGAYWPWLKKNVLEPLL